MLTANSPDATSEGGVAATDFTYDDDDDDDDREVTLGGTDGGLPLFVAEEGDCCGSSNPDVVKHCSPLKFAAAAVAHVWKELLL